MRQKKYSSELSKDRGTKKFSNAGKTLFWDRSHVVEFLHLENKQQIMPKMCTRIRNLLVFCL